MAIFHLSAKIISRSSGRSAAAAMAYRAGCKLVDDARTGLTFDYRRKRDVIYTRVIAPKHAPAWMTDIQALANAIEARNTRKDSQLVREYEIAAPIELGHQAQIKLMERFVYSQFIKRGMVVQASLHDGGKGNPHFHLVASLNEIDATHPTGFGKKAREWNEVALLNEVRYQWEVHCNRFLSTRGHKCSIDHRTLQAQGIDRKPIERLSRLDWAGQQRRAIKQTNNDEENTMTQPYQPATKNISIENLPQFRQPDKVRMNQLHAKVIKMVAPPQWPNYHAEQSYCHQLAEFFNIPGEQVAWTATDFGCGYRAKLETGSIIDYGDTLRCETSSAMEIDALIKLAKAKGWQVMALRGNESFKQQAFVIAVAQGFAVNAIEGYTPTAQDIAMANQLKLALAQAQAQLVIAQACTTSQATGQGQATTTLAIAPPSFAPQSTKPKGKKI